MHLVRAAEDNADKEGKDQTNKDDMKILLQHMRTNLYLRSLGSWTDNPEEAHDFKHSQRLLDFVGNNGLEGVQIAVKFFESQYDEIFPIPSNLPVAMARA